tara:strand:+ start:1823 stop:3199 length:1377 start_codon:yes stop_codon:yes gene_type:complete
MIFLILTPLVSGCIDADVQDEPIEPQIEPEIDTGEQEQPLEPEIDADEQDEPISLEYALDFTFELERTAENPLRGFYTNYDWGEPVYDFPSSLEFAYIPLSELMSGPSNFTFDTGLEPRLLAAEERSHQLILRPYIDYPTKASGLPAYLEEQVEMQSYTEHGGGMSPDYNNSELRAAISSFIQAFGEAYDGDTRIAVIQLGLLGFWGEWHTWPHTEWFPGDEYLTEVLNTYDNSFNETLLQVRYPVANSPNLDIGFHDDSFAHSTIGDVEWYFHPRLVSSGADEHWKNSPIGGELRPEVQQSIFEENSNSQHQNFTQCVEATHASMLLNYAAFSGGLNSSNETENAEAAALSLGYALHVSHATLSNNQLNITIVNYGNAPFYYPLSLQIIDSANTTLMLELPQYLLGQVGSTLTLDVSSLQQLNNESTWVLSLHSDYVLPNQEILFATAPGNGWIQVK